MAKSAAIFLLILGIFWTLFLVFLLLTLGGIAGPPESIWKLSIYWTGLFMCPTILIIGSALSLRDPTSRIAIVFVIVGCITYTCFAVYNSIEGMDRQPLQAPPPYWIYVLFLILMALADFAAYLLFKDRVRHLIKRTN